MRFLLPEVFFLLPPLDPVSINLCSVSIIFSVMPLLKPLSALISYHNAYILYSEWKRKLCDRVYTVSFISIVSYDGIISLLNWMGSNHDELTPEIGIYQLLVFFSMPFHLTVHSSWIYYPPTLVNYRNVCLFISNYHRYLPSGHACSYLFHWPDCFTTVGSLTLFP